MNYASGEAAFGGKKKSLRLIRPIPSSSANSTISAAIQKRVVVGGAKLLHIRMYRLIRQFPDPPSLLLSLSLGLSLSLSLSQNVLASPR